MCWCWLVAQFRVTQVILGESCHEQHCASPLHTWAVLCCWRARSGHGPVASCYTGAQTGTPQVLLRCFGEQRWLLCSQQLESAPAQCYTILQCLGSLCQTRNKVSSQFPSVLGTQDASCSEQEPGRSFECSGIQEGLPSSFTTYVKSLCLSSFLQRLLTQPSDRGPAVVWIQKLWPGVTSSGSGILTFSPGCANSFLLSLLN